MKKALFFAFMMGAISLSGCFGWWGGSSSSRESSYSPPPTNRGGPPPPAPGSAPTYGGGANLFRLPMSDGRAVTVKAPAVLFFYTSWCGYCKQALPEFKQITSRARNQGWRVYGIQVGEGPDKVNEFIARYQPNFPVLMDQQSLVSRQYRIEGYPTFVIIDENGRVSYNSHDLPRAF